MKFPLFSPRAAPKKGAQASRGEQSPGEESPTPTPKPAASGSRYAWTREAGAVVLLAACLYSSLALASFRADPLRPEVHGADWVGPVGAAFAELTVGLVGLAAWVLPAELFALALPLLRPPAPRRAGPWVRLAGDVAVVSIVAALAHVAAPAASFFGGMPIGGSVGELLGEVLRSLFSAVGSFIIGGTLIVLVLVGRASFSFIATMHRVANLARALFDKLCEGFARLSAAWRDAGALEAVGVGGSVAIGEREADAIIEALSDEQEGVVRGDELLAARVAPAGERVSTPSPPAVTSELPPLTSDVPTPSPTSGATLADVFADVPTPSPIPPARVAPEPRRKAPSRTAPRVETPESASAIEVAPRPRAFPVDDAPRDDAKPKRSKAARTGLRIVDTSEACVTEKVEPAKVVPAVGCGFRLPNFDMLDEKGPTSVVIDEAELEQTAARLEKVLTDYGVSGKVVEVLPGPTVTTFEVVPAAGTKVSKVAGLADDLALGLSVKVRIIAPIPGKNRIGFEVPNPERSPVNLRELIEDRRFQEMKAPLPCVMGRDIVGAPYFADMASMPHVIVAGATGAGKSVGLNVMLVSLLYRRTPDELRLLMIDPKVVELAPFDRIPHMLLPVVTDMKQAATALRWAVDEMERRYQLFANAGTKNIGTYNGWVERVLSGQAKPPKGPSKVAAIAPDGTEVEVDAAKDGSDAELPQKLPYIVIVVDEFADLMMQQGKDVEASVARLAQKARAAGMHVILATQRPSVDVITGMIKANFPTRVAFRVAQKVDSRTILDEQGAEHLLGRGDMLVKMNGSNETRRVQGPFCTEEEVQRVTDFLRLQGEPVYDEDILKPRDDEDGGAGDEDGETDALYDQAVQIVAETRRCSTSWLQRKLGIGYNRAAKIVETMERRGIVGPAQGAKDREILIEAH